MKVIKTLVIQFARKRIFQDFWYGLYKASLIGMNIGPGGGVSRSGEKEVIKYVSMQVSKIEKPVFFDVGANIGGYTHELLKYNERAQIHCFEPAKETFCSLSRNINAKNVILNNFGISDTQSDGILYSDKENSGLASLYNRQLDYLGIDFSNSETVMLDTIDHYCKEKNISRIDLLKMDIEGNELRALYGASEMLRNGKINVIQIEFGGCNVDSRTYFRDFWNLLHDEFRVYRIVQDGLYEIKKYSEKLEIFGCSNYLFVKKAI